MAQYIEFTPEQKERAATVDLEEFLLRQGEKLIKSGREKRLASDHSVTVRGCEWFDHASNEGGRAVSFIQKYYGKSYVEAMSMLLGESMEPVYPQAKKQEPVDQKPFAPPVPNANMHRVFAYLLKTRGLDADVVSFFARKKMLYEDGAHHNAVFIGTDEGGCPRHAHLRSTNSFGKAFRLNVESSDPRYSFHHTGTDGSLYVFEAPIDMLSYISMNPRQWQEHSYVPIHPKAALASCLAMISSADNGTPAQPQRNVMGAARRDPRRGARPVRSASCRSAAALAPGRSVEQERASKFQVKTAG